VILAGGRPWEDRARREDRSGAAKAVLREAQEKDPGAGRAAGSRSSRWKCRRTSSRPRVLSEASRISGDRIRRGDISQRDFDEFVAGVAGAATLPLYIDDTPAITLSALRTRCRRLMRTKGLNLVIVDYLQLMRPARDRSPENRVQEISQITQGLKAIAKELSVPVIALSQLSRAVEQREDKRPQLSDLRESGSIEQDADVVMFIYRDEYYLQMKQPEGDRLRRRDQVQARWRSGRRTWSRVPQQGELLVAKQRHGPTAYVPLFFEGEFTRFGDLDTTHDEGRY
jgi:replicative DNA helicase